MDRVKRKKIAEGYGVHVNCSNVFCPHKKRIVDVVYNMKTDSLHGNKVLRVHLPRGVKMSDSDSDNGAAPSEGSQSAETETSDT